MGVFLVYDTWDVKIPIITASLQQQIMQTHVYDLSGCSDNKLWTYIELHHM